MKKVLLKIHRLLVDFNEDSTKKHLHHLGLNVAGIHATLLALFIAIITAYIFVSFIILKNLEKKVLDEAEKINSIQYADSMYRPKKDELPPINNFSDLWNQAVCLNFLIQNVTYGPELLEKISSYCKIPEKPVDRAEKIFKLIYHITHRYPFPINKTLKVNDKRPLYGLEAIHFEGIDDVKDWLNALNDNLYAQNMVFMNMNLFGTPDELIKTLYNKEKKMIEFRNKNSKFFLQEEANPYNIFQNFITNRILVYSVLTSTHNHLKRYEKVKSKNLPKSLIIIIAVTGILAFGAGVVWPIFHKNFNYYIANFLPILFYIIVVTALSFKLFYFLQ